MQGFLTNRKHSTVLNLKTSEWGAIEAGVPQGSILGSLFFLICINDLTDGSKFNVKFLADDASIFTVFHDPNTAALDLNHDLSLSIFGRANGECLLTQIQISKQLR